ncbi:MAG: glycosyltransferase family 4 protein [bacterium]|nr:glycosyltransferase family 4 protein [bacterium]
MSVVILQRCVPHYRDTLFERLWQRYGWHVATSRDFPPTQLSLVDSDRDYLRRFDLRFPDPTDAYRCSVPVTEILRALRPAAVVCEFSLRMSSTYDLLARRKLGGGPAVYFWGHGYNMERGIEFPAILGQVPRIVASRLADGHVVYSAEGREFLESFVDRSRIVVAPNTIPRPDTAEEPGASRRRSGGPALISTGRFTADKRFPDMIRAFERIHAAFPEATLTILGDGPDLDDARRLAGERLGRSVFLPGAVYDEAQVAEHFRSSDVAVFSGAVGLSVNHALLHGVPVIAYDRLPHGPRHHPEIANVVDGVTGLRVRQFDDRTLARAVIEFLRRHPRPRESYAATIAGYAEEHLHIDRMLEGFDELREMMRTHGVAHA